MENDNGGSGEWDPCGVGGGDWWDPPPQLRT